MSNNDSPSTKASASLPRLIAVAGIAGVATWLAASMLASARAAREPQPHALTPEEVVFASAQQQAPGVDDEEPAATRPSPAWTAALEQRLRDRRREVIREQGDWASPGSTTTSPTKAAEVSEADWDAAADAMRPHAPNLVRRIERASKTGPMRNRMMRALVERHRELQRIQRRDEEQYKREIEQVVLEDEILGKSRELARQQDFASAYEVRVQLREMIGKLVDLRIRNREARLERLAGTVEAERKRLEEEKAGRERAIERQLSAVTKARGGGGGSPQRPPGGPDQPARPELAAPGRDGR